MESYQRVNPKLVKQLRDLTGISMMECKKALQETNEDLQKALAILKDRGLEIAKKKLGRKAKEGYIGSYVHMGGRIGVLLELNAETDFVAKNKMFKALLKDLCLQVAASAPKYVNIDDIPEEVIEAKSNELKGMASSIYPEESEEFKGYVKIEMQKFIENACLLEQAFIKDANKRVKELIQEIIPRFGENISIKRFCRFEIDKYEDGGSQV